MINPVEILTFGIPRPGDMLVARAKMRSWVSETERGHFADPETFSIDKGSVCMVIGSWFPDDQGLRLRMRLVVNGRMGVFSTHVHDLHSSWSIIRHKDDGV